MANVVLATWDNFRGGHWGNLGPHEAAPNQWGGVNMTVAEDGSLIPVNASRWLQLNASPKGKVWGMFWAWGADGNIYYVQQAGTSTTSSMVFRYNPDPASLPNTISTTTTFSYVPTTDPDFVELGTTVYMTVYGKTTYTINTTANTMVPLSGSYGVSPGARCIALYNQRLMVGGISDATFGTHTNRIHFSGDDNAATPDPTDRTAWIATNFFDLGTDGDVITGLYNLRDFMVAVLDDGSIYLLTGTPNVSLTARRVYGFHKGSGGLSAFLPSHGAVDPSQTRAWIFDHAYRTPVRFNGANITRAPLFGVAHKSRTGTDVVEGQLAMIGGPDEFIAHGVAVGRAAGEDTVSHNLEMVRINGVFTLVTNDVIASRQ